LNEQELYIYRDSEIVGRLEWSVFIHQHIHIHIWENKTKHIYKIC
jgi:hypothetical protein